MPLDGLALKRRFRRFLGSSVEFDLAPYMARHARIDRLATEVAATDDAGLTAWARRLKTRVGEGVSLDQVLDELFALAREASERVLGTRPFDEQIVGGLAMHQGFRQPRRRLRQPIFTKIGGRFADLGGFRGVRGL